MKLLSFSISYQWDKNAFSFQFIPHMEVNKSSGDPEIGLTVAPSSHGQAPGLELLEPQQWSIFLSALSHHENWLTQAAQWRKKLAKHVHDSKSWHIQVMFWGNQHCTKAPREAHGEWNRAACPSQELDRGTGTFLQTSPLTGSLIHGPIGQVLHMKTSKYKVSYKLACLQG